ncbi:MAG: helix-turn-helix domain-containing protein [Candidatus Hermodarchaeia archaeon]
MKLGKYLKEARRKKNITLRVAERLTGISNAYLSQLENGRISKPSPSILHKLADCYGVSYDRLMRLCGYPSPKTSKEVLSASFRLEDRFGDVTEDEVEKLEEYLEFLRSRRTK